MRIAGFDGHDGAPKGANFILSFLCFLDMVDTEEAPNETLGGSGDVILFDVLSDLKTQNPSQISLTTHLRTSLKSSALALVETDLAC